MSNVGGATLAQGMSQLGSLIQNTYEGVEARKNANLQMMIKLSQERDLAEQEEEYKKAAERLKVERSTNDATLTSNMVATGAAPVGISMEGMNSVLANKDAFAMLALGDKKTSAAYRDIGANLSLATHDAVKSGEVKGQFDQAVASASKVADEKLADHMEGYTPLVQGVASTELQESVDARNKILLDRDAEVMRARVQHDQKIAGFNVWRETEQKGVTSYQFDRGKFIDYMNTYHPELPAGKVEFLAKQVEESGKLVNEQSNAMIGQRTSADNAALDANAAQNAAVIGAAGVVLSTQVKAAQEGSSFSQGQLKADQDDVNKLASSFSEFDASTEAMGGEAIRTNVQNALQINLRVSTPIYEEAYKAAMAAELKRSGNLKDWTPEQVIEKLSVAEGTTKENVQNFVGSDGKPILATTVQQMNQIVARAAQAAIAKIGGEAQFDGTGRATNSKFFSEAKVKQAVDNMPGTIRSLRSLLPIMDVESKYNKSTSGKMAMLAQQPEEAQWPTLELKGGIAETNAFNAAKVQTGVYKQEEANQDLAAQATAMSGADLKPTQLQEPVAPAAKPVAPPNKPVAPNKQKKQKNAAKPAAKKAGTKKSAKDKLEEDD